ncbi:MAG: stalk domain-containing protein [Syntrophomonadaceae bacterium]
MLKSLRVVVVLLAILIGLPINIQPALSLEISNNPTIRNQDIYDKIQTIPLLSPTNLTAESTEIGKIVLHWNDNSTGESGFQIERKLSSDDTYFLVDSVGPNVTTCEQSELSTYAVFPGEDYYYRVRAFNSSANSGYSNEAYVIAKSNIPSPSAPAALRVKGMMVENHLTVRLYWGDTANNEEKYVVQRSKAGGGFVVAGELPANSVKFEEPADLERNVKYTYRVIAYNSGGAGVSNTADVTLPVNVPATPVFNQPQQGGSTKVFLTWNDNSNNEDGFKITRYGDKPYNPFTGVTPADQEYMLEPGAASLMITGLTPQKEYGFHLVAYNACGDSIPCIMSYNTGPPAPDPFNASAESPTHAKISWGKAIWGNYSGFSIERKTSGGIYAQVGTVAGDVLSYTDILLTPNTPYFYRARAWCKTYDNKYYWSDYSIEKGIKTPGVNASNVQTTINTDTGGLNTDINGQNPPDTSNSQNSGPSDSGNTVTTIDFTLGQRTYQVNGQALPLETAPVSLEGRTMLPVKYLAEPLKANLAWDALEQKVSISLNGKVIELFIGKNTALVNGQEVIIEPGNPAVVPVVSAEGRTLMPIGFISQNLGCQIEWNSATQTASLSYSGK